MPGPRSAEAPGGAAAAGQADPADSGLTDGESSSGQRSAGQPSGDSLGWPSAVPFAMPSPERFGVSPATSVGEGPLGRVGVPAAGAAAGVSADRSTDPSLDLATTASLTWAPTTWADPAAGSAPPVDPTGRTDRPAPRDGDFRDEDRGPERPRSGAPRSGPTQSGRTRSGRPRLTIGVAGLAVILVAALAATVGRSLGSASGSQAAWRDGDRTAPASAPNGAPPAAFETVTLSGVGDVIMGTAPGNLPPRDGAGFFDPVKDALSSDLVMGNLETPLTENTGTVKCGYVTPPATPGNPSPKPTKSSGCFQFYLPRSYANHLRAGGFDLLSLANNHTHDMGPTGLRNTRMLLSFGCGFKWRSRVSSLRSMAPDPSIRVSSGRTRTGPWCRYRP